MESYYPQPLSSTEIVLQTNKVELLLNEFYSVVSSNDRKRQIERELEIYKNATQFYEFLVYDINNINNTFMWFFKISCLETAIIKESLDLDRQKNLTNHLWTCYKNIPEHSPKIQRDKLAQLLVHLLLKNFQANDEIAFLDEVTKLINEKFLFGVILLRTLSEEIFSTRSNVCVQKKEFIRICLSSKLQPICDVFQNYIVFLFNYLDQKSLHMNKTDIDELIIEFLSCVQHLLSWIKLESLVTEVFLDKLFKLATLQFTNNADISLAALTTICELFYRQTALPLPEQTTKNIIILLEDSNIVTNEIAYLEKITELLTLFAAKPYSKWIDEQTFKYFLKCVYNFTTNTSLPNEGIEFANKIVIWNAIMKTHSDTIYGREAQLLRDLVVYTLKKQILFVKGSHAVFLDNQNLDDDMKTEWQHFVGPSIELVLHVMAHQPNYLIKILIEFWNLFLNHLLELKNYDIGQLNSTDGVQNLRNLSTLCQIFGMIPLTIDEPYPRELIDLVLHLDRPTELFNSIRAFSNREYETEAENFVAQFMSAVRCFVPIWEKKILTREVSVHTLLYMSLHYVAEKWHEPKLIQFEAAQLLLMISSTVRLKSMLDDEQIQSFLNANYDTEQLSVKLINRSSKCRHDFVPIIVFESLCNILLLPWTDVATDGQMFEQRDLLLMNFIHRLASDFLVIDVKDGNEDMVCTAVTKCLPIVSEILEYYRDWNNLIKVRIMKTYEAIILKAVTILNVYNPNGLKPVAFECIVEFTKSVIITLQNQFSIATIKELLEIILGATMKITNVQHQFKSVDKLLQILTYIVEKPGNISKTMFPCAIRFALDHVLPMIQNETSAKFMDGVVVSMYTLLDSILQNKWNNFYSPQVLNKPVCDGDLYDSVPYEELKNQEDFMNIFMAYGYGLMSWNDPEVKQIILNSMQTLNERKRLYARDCFRKNLLHHFLGAFLKTIMLAEGTLHYDMLMTIIFTMGQVDKMILRQAFLEYGYVEASEIVSNVLTAGDLPTFSENMSKLVYDTKLYTKFNNSM